MPLQYRGSMSFSDIRNEFSPGTSGPISLSQYYRGGGRVDNDPFVYSNIDGGNIPASGTVKVRDFFGTTNGKTYITFEAGPDISNGGFSSINNSGTGSTKYHNVNSPPFWLRKIQYQLWGGGGGASRSYYQRMIISLNVDIFVAGGGAGGYRTGTLNFTIPQNATRGPYLEIGVGGGGGGSFYRDITFGFPDVRSYAGGNGADTFLAVYNDFAVNKTLALAVAGGGKGGLANIVSNATCYGKDDGCREVARGNKPLETYGAGGSPSENFRGATTWKYAFGTGLAGNEPQAYIDRSSQYGLPNNGHNNSGGGAYSKRVWGGVQEDNNVSYSSGGYKGKAIIRY